MHSVEVVLDDQADRQVRGDWQQLAAAGLPSQANHTGASNRPHITLALADTIAPDVDERLRSGVAGLPLPIVVGGLLIFGGRRFVLARLAVPSAALLDLQARVLDALDDPVDPHHTFGPGRWTPHVTLARRLTADQVGTALAALGEVPPIAGRLVRARRWDMAVKREDWLSVRDCI